MLRLYMFGKFSFYESKVPTVLVLWIELEVMLISAGRLSMLLNVTCKLVNLAFGLKQR
jgi:hypothetical protein